MFLLFTYRQNSEFGAANDLDSKVKDRGRSCQNGSSGSHPQEDSFLDSTNPFEEIRQQS